MGVDVGVCMREGGGGRERESVCVLLGLPVRITQDFKANTGICEPKYNSIVHKQSNFKA